MPSIDQKIKAQAELVDDSLRHLPDLPSQNVQHVVRQCLQEFSNGVRSLLEGGTNSNAFLSEWSTLSTDFGQVIQKMKPMFNITDSSDQALPEVINLDDDSDCETTSSFTPSTIRKHANDFTSPSGKRQKINDSAIPFHRG